MTPPYYIDLHSDTITKLCYPIENLNRNRKMVTIKRMIQGGTLIQCFSAFVPTGLYPKPLINTLSWARFLAIARKKDCLIRQHNLELTPICSAHDLEMLPLHYLRRIGVLFTIEDAGIFQADITRVQSAYDRGVRIASLTWNHENTLAYPNSTNPVIMQKGLKPFGLEVLEEMNRLGIIIDVSHLSDGGFWNVAKYSHSPFIASHSNSRLLTNHPRNLTDDMLRILANKGGVAGLNFAPAFLSSNIKESNISDMVAHICHIKDIAGSEVLAIGSDFDGIHGRLQIQTPADIPLLYDALLHAGLTHHELENMWYRNSLRIFKEVFKS